MEELKASLRFGGILSNKEIELVISHFENKYLPPRADFLSLGDVSNEIGFIKTGIMRMYSTNGESIVVTKAFYGENQFIVDLESYYGVKPTKNPLQAVIGCEVLFIRREPWEMLIRQIPKLFILSKCMAETIMLNSMKDQDFLHFGTAIDKYQIFMSRYPELSTLVPQQYIASYLGIAPQSLSRIRKTMKA